MISTRTPSLSDIRFVFRLIHECCVLGDDAIAWRRHAIAALCRETGAQSGCAVVHEQAARRSVRRVVVSVRGGPTASVATDVSADAPLPDGVGASSGVATVAKCETEHRSLIALPGGVFTVEFAIANGYPFSERERGLVDLFHAELAELWREHEPLASAAAEAMPLPARLREVLTFLTGTEAEKQIAARMGLSPGTVHKYVTAIYRRYGVSSRTELYGKVGRSIWRCPRLLP